MPIEAAITRGSVASTVPRAYKKSTTERLALAFLSVCIVIAGAAGCDLVPRSALAAEEQAWTTGGSEARLDPSAFTVVVLPDTQYYSAKYPGILAAQTRWIVAKRDAAGIALVMHEGDIVDKDEPLQWERASSSLHGLDGVVPYVLSTGNHDYDRAANFISRSTLIDQYFSERGLDRGTANEGTFEAGHIENSYQVVETPGGPWLILAIEFGPRDAVLAWADGIAKRFGQMPAVVLTHAYLYSDNTRYDHVLRPDQLWNPHRYLSDASPGGVNDGEEIWKKLVVKNDNILFVLCGHDLGAGIGRLTSTRPDGTKVHQILANYQMEARGGEGYLRLMRFSPTQRKVVILTYSPYLDRFKVDSDNQFTLDY
jgi:hypothetical protein